MRVSVAAAVLMGLVGVGIGPSSAQSGQSPAAQAAQPPAPETQPAAQAAPAAQPAPTAQPAPAAAHTYTVPSGTKILLQLRSSINTKSAKPGDGVYLSSSFPVVVGNRVMIPVGVYVQGVVDRVQRAGHVKGKAELDMHLTSIIFPNGSVVEIPGVVDALPGTKKQQVKNNGEGTIQQDSDKTRNMGQVAEVAIPAGGTVGAISGVPSGHPLAGGLAGMGAGLATAGLVSLFTRGADVNIESGTQVEMVLQRPLILEDQNLSSTGATAAPAPLTPAPGQPKPLDKPHHVGILCPLGGLGCG